MLFWIVFFGGLVVAAFVFGVVAGKVIAFGQRPVPLPTREVFDRERTDALRRLLDERKAS